MPEYLKGWTLNFLAAVAEDGSIPGCVTTTGPEKGHRAFQMKPFLSQGAYLAATLLDDWTWLSPTYERLVKAVTHRERTHFDAGLGLFFWDNAMQSGADNNPAITNDIDLEGRILACDVNAFMFREYEALAIIAEKLGHPEDKRRFARARDELQGAVNERLWCESDGTYWNLHRDTREFVRAVSYSNFVPLWANLAPPERGRRMIGGYLWNESHMLGPFGLRSLSVRHPLYNNQKTIQPHSNWQGPIWIIANYIFFEGLLNYGFENEARELATRVANLCLADIEVCGSMHENYHAETGDPLEPCAEHSKDGAEGGFIGWNLLIENMLRRFE
jgi:alpha,alpha-trehalase